MPFEAFPKIPRLRRDCTITEKIDGTNAQVYLVPAAEYTAMPLPALAVVDDLVLLAGSRTRWIWADEDNFGFAKWVIANADELAKLGPGRHFGEWYGAGIQRRYGLDHKRFALFDVDRWGVDRPACCHVVPTLYRGPFADGAVNTALNMLRHNGSYAVDTLGAFMQPEGIIVWMHASRTMHKVTLEKDEAPKGDR